MSSNLFEAFFWIEPKRNSPFQAFSSCSICWCYPTDVSLSSSYGEIPAFCFPDIEKVKIEKLESSRIEHYTFILREVNGVEGRLYGVCMRALSDGEGQRYDVKRRPRHCLCILTKQPFFATFKTLLHQIHGLWLTTNDQTVLLKFIDKLYKQPFSIPESSYLGRLKAVGTDSVTVLQSEFQDINQDFSLKLPHFSGSSRQDVALLPLLTTFGTEKLMTLLSAILSERRVIFVAENVDTLSSTIHASTAMIYPFTWHHIFIPCLPSNLLFYAELQSPFLIGIKKYLYPQLLKLVIGSVLVADVDEGSLRFHGNICIPDFVGTSGSKVVSAVEKVDMVKRKTSDIFNRTLQAINTTAKSPPITTTTDTGPKDIVNAMFQELSSILSKRPGTNKIKDAVKRALPGATTTLEENKLEWELEAEKSLRSTLLHFFVYVFHEFDDFISKSSDTPNNTNSAVRGFNPFSNPVDTHEKLGYRFSFDLKGFLERRRVLGDSKYLQDFLMEFIDTQIFDNFCRERYNKVQSNRSSRSLLKATTRKKYIEINTSDFDDDEKYDIVIAEMTNCQFGPTIKNVRAAISKVRRDQEAFQRDPESDASNRWASSNFHPITVHFTSAQKSATEFVFSSSSNIASTTPSQPIMNGNLNATTLPPIGQGSNRNGPLRKSQEDDDDSSASNSSNRSVASPRDPMNSNFHTHTYNGQTNHIPELPDTYTRTFLYKRRGSNKPGDHLERSQSAKNLLQLDALPSTSTSSRVVVKYSGADDTMTEKRNSSRVAKLRSIDTSESDSSRQLNHIGASCSDKEKESSSSTKPALMFRFKNKAVEFFSKQVFATAPVNPATRSQSQASSTIHSTDSASIDNDFAAQYMINKICSDSHRSDLFSRIMCTILTRLRTCVNSSGRGNAGSDGQRALILLRHLLVQGPESVLSVSFEFIPLITVLLRRQKKFNNALEYLSGIVDCRAAARTVLELLLDHKKLKRQRTYFSIAKHNYFPYMKPTLHYVGISTNTSDCTTADTSTPIDGQTNGNGRTKNNALSAADQVFEMLKDDISKGISLPSFQSLHLQFKPSVLTSITQRISLRVSTIVPRSSLFDYRVEIVNL